jgi:hypothetical protein
LISGNEKDFKQKGGRMEQQSLNNLQRMEVENLLAEAEYLVSQGDRNQAYQYCLEATRKAPRKMQAWLWRADTAASLEEKMMCLSRLCALNPHFLPARQKMYATLSDLLHREPFLAYIDETQDLYQVRSGLDIYLNVPKSRAIPEKYPAARPEALKSIYNWLLLSMIGLLLGGVGAVFLAPIAAAKTFMLQLKPQPHSDQVRTLVALLLAVLIWLAAFPLGVLFVLHLVQ